MSSCHFKWTGLPLFVCSCVDVCVSALLQAAGGVDWRAELLDAVRQVFLRERSVLKNILYSQLDLLDTSDAIIHLNQLESRLAEQVSDNSCENVLA